MKLTKQQLKQLIKEELQTVQLLNEGNASQGFQQKQLIALNGIGVTLNRILTALTSADPIPGPAEND